jgi:type II secretory pathway pseudopilin PulG
MFRNLKKTYSKNAFSLVEVVVATLVFSLAAAGIIATISALTQPAAQSSREVKAAMLGKQILENLRNSVDAETWGQATSPLSPIGGPHNNGTYDAIFPIPIDGTDYTPTYQVTDDPDTEGIWVNTTITWTE